MGIWGQLPEKECGPSISVYPANADASGKTAAARLRVEHRIMIEALKSEDIVNRVGGRFKLCTLIQRRLVQLMDGSRPLVDRDGRSDLELAIEEIAQGKITYEFDPEAEVPAAKILGEREANRMKEQLEGN